MEFKDQIKCARETVHMSQQEFAAAIGVAHSSLNRWELGIRKPTYALQRKFYDYCKNNDNICEVLHCEMTACFKNSYNCLDQCCNKQHDDHGVCQSV